jgi:magnesium chelatase subunit H
MDLITQMEANGICPVPVFINGIESHTIVRDLLTSEHEIKEVQDGTIVRLDSFRKDCAVTIDCIVSTIGFPLVGGPAGSFEAGRNVAVAEKILSDMNVPYFIASPLLLQSISQWKQNGVLGLQSVVLYSLPELDGAIDTVILGGLVGDKIALLPERVRKLASRIKGWVQLRKTPKNERKLSIVLYGFPPNVGAVGTAALLDVPRSLDNLLKRMHVEGYDVGDFATDQDACGESIVAALSILNEDAVISAGTERMQQTLDVRIERAVKGIQPTPETLAKPNAGLGGAAIRALTVSSDDLEAVMGMYMWTKVRRAWPEKERGPGISSSGEMIVTGLQLGNIWITVQPLLGVEGDPMRLLFQRDLTPHPQYCASYEYLQLPEDQGGIGAQCVIHLGMHGTLEWLPGKSLGNDRLSWSDELIGGLPNIYVYAANNPSESMLAKRRAYGTLVSYNVPPYGRAGLYLDLANLKDLLIEYRTSKSKDLRQPIFSTCQRCGIESEMPLPLNNQSAFDGSDLASSISSDVFDEWVVSVANYLELLQERLFSSGLHILGNRPSEEDLQGYLSAFYGDSLSKEDYKLIFHKSQRQDSGKQMQWHLPKLLYNIAHTLGIGIINKSESKNEKDLKIDEAMKIVSLLLKTTEELDSIFTGLDGGYIPPKPGGDLLR